MKQYTVDRKLIEDAAEVARNFGEDQSSFDKILIEMDQRTAEGWTPFVVVTEMDDGTMYLKVDVTVEGILPN